MKNKNTTFYRFNRYNKSNTSNLINKIYLFVPHIDQYNP